MRRVSLTDQLSVPLFHGVKYLRSDLSDFVNNIQMLVCFTAALDLE